MVNIVIQEVSDPPLVESQTRKAATNIVKLPTRVNAACIATRIVLQMHIYKDECNKRDRI